MNSLASYPGKRALDIIGSSVLIITLSPLFVILAFLVRIKMGSPILFRQRRPGLFENHFMMLKFRTMNEGRDGEGELLPDNERLTGFGRFLRTTSLDELPELLNVLRGHMSLVGPRPLVTEYLPYYTDRERIRFLARPGITGLAQVSGRNTLDWDTRLELDARYVETLSFPRDFRILFRTLQTVFLREGVSADADEAETWLHEERADQTTDSSRRSGAMEE